MRCAVFTIKSWNIEYFAREIERFPGQWTLFSDRADLTLKRLCELDPDYVFFPHWSWMVPQAIIERFACVCFHETDLPFGRGGSPIQNLIARGVERTMVSAIRMNEALDAGDVYLKRPLSLHGLAEEIYLRCARLVGEMMLEIATDRPTPKPQEGEPVVFTRRTPDQSVLPQAPTTLEAVFDHIRMLDAESYPPAFLVYNGLRIEFSRPALRVGRVVCDATITIIKDENS